MAARIGDDWPLVAAQAVQQTAYQPSGKGINPQAIWLSLAARGRLEFDAQGRKSSCETGATAALTASSRRSNSTSLIALSEVSADTISEFFWFKIEGIIQIVPIDPS
jgi:hypothetical protein